MRIPYLIASLVLILLNMNGCLSRIKSRHSKTPKRTSSSVRKPGSPSKLGQLFYRGSQLPIQLNQTEEHEVYAANYTMFPDALYYPRASTDTDIEEFLQKCMNVTLKAETNKEKISKLRNSEEIYMRVVQRIVEFLCLDNFSRVNNTADLPVGRLWEMAIAVVISIAFKFPV